MTDVHIPDHVGLEAVRLLNRELGRERLSWPQSHDAAAVITVAKLLMNPPAPMTDPDEEAAKRVVVEFLQGSGPNDGHIRATEQIRKEFAARKEAWEAGR